ncbi:hypothetical protein [Novipirellula caenicola]|uniref:Uncharacterized protein n=1 Tax=Novipirellula caenicola TaxID=1536901 RepID=A0ABP9VUR5_9BACT
MRFFVDSINESSLILGRNENTDIPVGSVFTLIGKTRLNDRTTWTSTDLGAVATVSLTLVIVHWYQREIDNVPGGHTAGLAVSGTGLDLLSEHLDRLADDESLYLAAA